MSVGHWLNRTLQVWRPSTEPDGAGGQKVTYVRQPVDVRAKVDQPAAVEHIEAGKGGAEHTHPVYLDPAADVRRGDELRGTDGRGTAQRLRVVSTVTPSTPRYLK
uniref:phage head completion protein n=1 Tax=Streptomyces phytophilus TaxID=722715 RepID=UPI0015F02740